jgi:two-component system, cell cycle sensor histidine kinase and response regulator CckA
LNPHGVPGQASEPTPAKLGEPDAYFRSAFEHAAIGMALVAPDGQLLRVNRSVCEFLGRSAEELCDLTFQDITHPDDLATDLDNVRRLLAGDIHAYTLEKRYLRRDGHVVWGLLSVSLMRDADGSPLHFISQVQDVTERKRAEAALQESEARYEEIAANVPGMVYQFVYKPDGGKVFTVVSEGVRELFGVEPEAALRDPAAIFSLVHPEDRASFQASGDASKAALVPWRWEGRAVLATGEVKWIQAVSRPTLMPDGSIVCPGVIVDVTERRKLQEQLRQGQRLEALGSLAGGIAHDFNNLLTAILSHSELVLGELPNGPLRDDIETIRQTAERAAGLTRQLLAFSRQQLVEPRLLEPNAVVTSTERMLRRTLGAGIRLEVDLAPSLGTVLADPGQLEQVLVNLALNARDAMPAGGTLTIRTRDMAIDASYAEQHAGLQPGTYVVLEVEDTGVGITPDVQARIFEPFFTTKPVGQGTGLGLATVYGIVTKWGGFTAVQSVPGTGTLFTIYLPRQERTPEFARPEASPALPTGREIILVVDDEATVRDSIRRILTRRGYAVLEAPHGAEALRLIDTAIRVDLVLTDLVMPEMGGRELIAALRARPAAPKTLVMSGYDALAAMPGEPLPPGTGFLEKPFTMEGLLRAVRTALDVSTAE